MRTTQTTIALHSPTTFTVAGNYQRLISSPKQVESAVKKLINSESVHKIIDWLQKRVFFLINFIRLNSIFFGLLLFNHRAAVSGMEIC